MFRFAESLRKTCLGRRLPSILRALVNSSVADRDSQGQGNERLVIPCPLSSMSILGELELN